MSPLSEEQRATAAALGFGSGEDAVLRMNRGHDPGHVLVARLLGLQWSPTLHWVATGEPAHPTRHEDAVGAEEALVLALQQWAQTGEFNGAVRLFWLLGREPESVKATYLRMLEGGR